MDRSEEEKKARSHALLSYLRQERWQELEALAVLALAMSFLLWVMSR